MIPSAGLYISISHCSLTDSVQTFVVKLRYSWLPLVYAVGVREIRCSAETISPQCSEIIAPPVYVAIAQKPDCTPPVAPLPGRRPWRFWFLTPLLSGHLRDTHNVDTLRYIILYGIRAGLPPAQGMILIALIPIVQVGCFQVLKGYIPDEWSLQRFYTNQRKMSSTSGEQFRNEITCWIFSGCTATRFRKFGVKLHTHLEDSPDNSRARSGQAAQRRGGNGYSTQSGSSELLAWAKTMLPSPIKGLARAQLHRSSRHPPYFSKAAIAQPRL
jgi:hypothetical protein